MSETRIIPFQREDSLWPSSSLNRGSDWSKDLMDLDRHWRDVDRHFREMEERFWKDRPTYRPPALSSSAPWDVDFFRPSDVMRRMQDEIERLKREAGFDSSLTRPSLLHDNMGIVPRKDAFEVSLDVAGFKPEELVVNLNNDQLTLSGKHEEKSADGTRFVSRQFTRKYQLPQDVDPEKMKSSLAADGRTLRVEAPRSLPHDTDTRIPITHENNNNSSSMIKG